MLFGERERKQHGAQRESGAQFAFVTRIVRVVDDNSLKEELETCEHCLVVCGMENGRHRVFIFAMDTGRKIGYFFGSLKCAIELKVAIGVPVKT